MDWSSHPFAIGAYFGSAVDHVPTILLSVMVAVLASYVAIDLAGRVRSVLDMVSGRLWILAGAVAMGTGIWSMHFVGMAAVDYPFEARFAGTRTSLSWLIAVLVAAVPIHAAARARLAGRDIVLAATLTSGGIAAMHFVGVDALATSLAPRLSMGWILVAFAVATLGCGQALALTAAHRDRHGVARIRGQLLAASILGGSLAGLHYLAMAAADFPPGTVCTATDGLEASLLGASVGVVSLGFLALMLLVSTLERRTQRVARRLDASLNKAREALDYVTFNDAVTGLPNRLVFQNRLRQAAERCEGTAESLAVMLIEIDGFVRLSRTHPPTVIEQVLREVGSRLVDAAGESSTVACAGGHQFLVLTAARPGLDTGPAIAIAAAVARAMQRPFDGGEGVDLGRLSTSIGISLLPGEGGAAKISGNANVAMEAARAGGGNAFAFFEAEMDLDARAMSGSLDELGRAVANGELELHYQPKVDAQSGQIAGVEALLRWRHPVRGLIGPANFIPLAERFGLIDELGRWVLDEACRQMAVWGDLGLRMRVAVNVSVGQLRDPTFADQVDAALRRHAIEPAQLTCEITESGAMQDTDATLAVFRRLDAAGVLISIDDFGTGYSSLSLLRKMPVQQLKIDRSFVSDLGADADARAVVQAIMDLARALRLEVVAEGVETAEQRDILLEMRCDKFQGYLYARPMTADALAALMTDRSATQLGFRESVFVE